MAIAGWLVWREAGWSLALVLWMLQLAANAMWSALFFGLRRIGLALIDALAMWVLVAAFIAVAVPLSIWAAIMFVPYLAWLSLAVGLNWSIWCRNGTAAAAD
jgi:benzodiazapine receptor